MEASNKMKYSVHIEFRRGDSIILHDIESWEVENGCFFAGTLVDYGRSVLYSRIIPIDLIDGITIEPEEPKHE